MAVEEIGFDIYPNDLMELVQQATAAQKMSNGPAKINLTLEHGHLTKWAIQASEITEHVWSGEVTDEAPKVDYISYNAEFD